MLSVAILFVKLLTDRLTFDNTRLVDSERGSFDASVWKTICEIRKDLNEREK